MKEPVKGYGGESLEIPPDNIHIIEISDESKLTKEQKEELEMLREKSFYTPEG